MLSKVPRSERGVNRGETRVGAVERGGGNDGKLVSVVKRQSK